MTHRNNKKDFNEVKITNLDDDVSVVEEKLNESVTVHDKSKIPVSKSKRHDPLSNANYRDPLAGSEYRDPLRGNIEKPGNRSQNTKTDTIVTAGAKSSKETVQGSNTQVTRTTILANGLPHRPVLTSSTVDTTKMKATKTNMPATSVLLGKHSNAMQKIDKNKKGLGHNAEDIVLDDLDDY